MSLERILRLQQITGSLLVYAKKIDFTIVVVPGKIAAAQTSETIEKEKAIHRLLDYCATHHNATLRFNTSGMFLKAHSDP